MTYETHLKFATICQRNNNLHPMQRIQFPSQTHLKGFVNLKGGKGNALLYSVLPSASDIPSDVPFLLDESVVLDDDGVFEVHVSVGRCHVKLPGSATAVDWHIESGSSWVCG